MAKTNNTVKVIEKEAFELVRQYYAHDRRSETQRKGLKIKYETLKRSVYFTFDNTGPRWIYRFMIDLDEYFKN